MNEAEPRLIRQHRIWSSIIQGVVTGITLVVLLLVLTLLSGNTQQKTLNDIKAATRAQACVLTLPVEASGRSEGAVNSRCLVPNGIPPVDTNGNGVVEYEGS
jgi:hypothetical protein